MYKMFGLSALTSQCWALPSSHFRRARSTQIFTYIETTENTPINIFLAINLDSRQRIIKQKRVTHFRTATKQKSIFGNQFVIQPVPFVVTKLMSLQRLKKDCKFNWHLSSSNSIKWQMVAFPVVSSQCHSEKIEINITFYV